MWLHLKTRDAAAEISVDPEVIAELRALMPAPSDEPSRWPQFILQSMRVPKPDSLRPYYRAEETLDRLNAWLRGKGIRANKPLHELRMEVGAIIATEQGIYTASKFLRHSDITTTARCYVDHKTQGCPRASANCSIRRRRFSTETNSPTLMRTLPSDTHAIRENKAREEKRPPTARRGELEA